MEGVETHIERDPEGHPQFVRLVHRASQVTVTVEIMDGESVEVALAHAQALLREVLEP